MESHLLQMRGLKLKVILARGLDCGVASFTDAWIETASGSQQQFGLLCRIFYRCVD